MHHARASWQRILGVYGLVCVVVFGVTRLEPIAGVGRYVQLLVAAIFLLAAIRLQQKGFDDREILDMIDSALLEEYR